MLDKIDLSNSRTVTILVIVCILLFACIYVVVNKQNNLEGFAESVLETGDTVRLKDGLKGVMLGTTGSNNVNDYINSLMPAMSVIAYYGDTAPAGWQICDGKALKFANVNIIVQDNNNNDIYTPDLKGRVIIGVNPTTDTTNGISARKLKDNGGAETHTLSISEMPAHNHDIDYTNVGCKGTYCGTYSDGQINSTLSDAGATYKFPQALNNTKIKNSGGGQPHNNMQPYYVLNYIIKQPIKP